ncbi:hypothetical protein QQF64_021668 [Cirrhinus molitorella]|uniref:Uncharacterized protein n=1 Tax=Cirrhinus molitorella TaxID=172907 RepID=A0ABR3L7H6_9TELE
MINRLEVSPLFRACISTAFSNSTTHPTTGTFGLNDKILKRTPVQKLHSISIQKMAAPENTGPNCSITNEGFTVPCMSSSEVQACIKMLKSQQGTSQPGVEEREVIACTCRLLLCRGSKFKSRSACLPHGSSSSKMLFFLPAPCLLYHRY